MKKKYLIPLLIGASLVLFSPMINKIIEQTLVYHPKPFPADAKHLYHNLPIKEIWFETGDGNRLNGWFLAKPQALGSLLWLHGNAGNLLDCVESLEGMFRALPLNILIFDYRGYGKSQGKPLEKRLYQDAEAGLLKLKSLVPDRPVFLYSHSLGVAVGTELASHNRLSGAIYEAGFTSLYDIGKLQYPWLPLKLVAGKKFNSIDKVSEIFSPKLFIHGTADEVVPFEQGERLFKAAAAPKYFYRVTDGDHNNNYIVDRDNYHRKIKEFVLEVIEGGSTDKTGKGLASIGGKTAR